MEQTLVGILACHPLSMAESLVSSTCCLGSNPAPILFVSCVTLDKLRYLSLRPVPLCNMGTETVSLIGIF